MYNYYLDHTPVDVSPQLVDTPSADQRSGGLFSALSGALSGGSLSDLFTEENLIVLGAVAFLTYDEGFDKEALLLCALCLLLGL